MGICSKCGFDSSTVACEKCGMHKERDEQLTPVWLERSEPKDLRFWAVLEIRGSINRFWLPTLIESLSENELFGLDPELQNRERWMYFCDDEDYLDELNLIYYEIKTRFAEFEQILARDPEEFRSIVQRVYWPKLLGSGASQRLVLDKFVFRNRRITENSFEGFWGRQHQNFANLGFKDYFLQMEKSLAEIASSSPQPLSDEERQLINYFHGAVLSGDSFRARSWKNRWTK